MIVCFPGRALSNDLINLPTVALIKGGFRSGAGVCECAFCLIMERSAIEHVRGSGAELGSVKPRP